MFKFADFSSEIFFDFFYKSSLSNNLFKLLSSYDAQTILIEQGYIDRDYLIDYSYYYSRCFESIERDTTRFHFFNSHITESDFKDFLQNYSISAQNDLQRKYLGFIVQKPIEIKNEKLIGKTIIKAPSIPKLFGKSNILYDIIPVHLCGLTLNVNGFQFCSQDQSTSACATMALWMCNKRLNSLFQFQMDTPYEITKKATSVLSSLKRDFPNNGLNIHEIINYFKINHLDFDSISCRSFLKQITESTDPSTLTAWYIKIRYFISAFLTADIPILLGIRFVCNNESEEFHAVAISGFKLEKDNKIVLYIHDDQKGPYCKVRVNEDLSLNCDWVKDNDPSDPYSIKKAYFDVLLAPLYHKIRQDFESMYLTFEQELLKYETSKILDLFLIDSLNYKNSLLINNGNPNFFEDLEITMPRFLWVLRSTAYKGSILDILFDTTNKSVPLKSFRKIISKNKGMP